MKNSKEFLINTLVVVFFLLCLPLIFPFMIVEAAWRIAGRFNEILAEKL